MIERRKQTTAVRAAVVLLLTAIMTKIWATPLDDYVQSPDSHYNWTKLQWEYRGPDFTIYAINMTSQKWLTDAESSQPIWWHYLYVAVPDVISRPDAASIYISGGSNGANAVPDIDDDFISFISLMAVSSGSIAANLRQVPNQPVVFKNDPTQKKRSEDAAIAWTWYEFITNNSSPEWLLHLPMTKATVRAMDTIAAFTKSIIPKSSIGKFLVCGESKRGWTTWTTAAVDKRVVAIVPMVMDLLNFVENLHHHYQSLGGWTFAFDDYYAVNITKYLDDPRTESMADIVDPFAYRDRLTMPKYVITTGGDEFFLLDDSYYYFHNMTGDIYLRIIPNAEHSLRFHRPVIFFDIRAFFLSVMDGTPRPKMNWTKTWTETNATLTMYTDTKPLEVNIYFARTIDGNRRRDFRLAAKDPYKPDGIIIHPVVWEKRPADVANDKEYYATFDNPDSGWIAFHIHALFKGPEDSDFEFTTENLILPNRLPFDPCVGEECYGKLV